VSEQQGPRQVSRRELLNIRERSWEFKLRGVSLVAEAEIPEKHRMQAAAALGILYGAQKRKTGSGEAVLAHWPACLVASMSGVAVMGYRHGTYWPLFWDASGFHGDTEDQAVWGQAFVSAARRLGLPTFSESHLRYLGPILMHAGIPVNCLGDFFRLLADRRRQEPGMDADAFLSWATTPGRSQRLSQLDKPAERFLLSGGDYAYDIVDRSIDLLDRLTDPEPDLDGVRLPAYMIEEAQREIANGDLDLSGTQRSHSRIGGCAGIVRQTQPRIALDPYGQGVQVLLPAVGDTPDGVARWRVTADGETRTVQSRAMWVGAAETTPPTAFPLNRPVRTVLVSLVGREALATELRVVEQADPVLFFGEDGRRLASTVSLPKSRVWIMHPADSELDFTGDPGQVTEPTVPFGWEGWRLRGMSLEKVLAVGLRGARIHPVEGKERPRLLLADPLAGVATPFGSPVYPIPPPLILPGSAASELSWHVEVRRSGYIAPLVSREIAGAGEVDIWDDVPRPALGSFEVTVRGPLARGMRRTIFVAEGLETSYEPPQRHLTRIGLAKGRATLTAAAGAVVTPGTLRFEPGQRSQPVEYRTDDESEPLVITPPHAAVLCPDAGVTTWTTSPLHLVTEDFAAAGRLLVRGLTGTLESPEPGKGQPELGVYVSGEPVQVIEASGQQTAGLARFELARAADTIAAHRRAELAIDMGDTVMTVAMIRPRKLASGVDLRDDTLALCDHVHVDGLTAGVYLAYAPWRPPAELPVEQDGTVALPEGLRNAGPLRVLLAIDDPWDPTNWPSWPGAAGYQCPALGIPASNDPDEEQLSRFVAGEDDTPKETAHLDWLWWLVRKSGHLVGAGARPDLAKRSSEALRERPREALMLLATAGLSHDDAVHAMIVTGLAADIPDLAGWQPDELAALSRLWTALPAAAAIAAGAIMTRADVADMAIASCGDSLTDILRGHPDPYAKVGRFGLDAERLALLPSEQVDSLWQAAAVVPQALLDADTRVTAARRMFDVRDMASVRTAATSAKPAAMSAKRAISESRYPHLAEAIVARLPREIKGGWLAIPAMSIALALTARLAARGNFRCRVLEREFHGEWITLAQYAPRLVAIDLVLAEALIVGSLAMATEEDSEETS
jgi:hypothetical protein